MPSIVHCSFFVWPSFYFFLSFLQLFTEKGGFRAILILCQVSVTCSLTAWLSVLLGFSCSLTRLFFKKNSPFLCILFLPNFPSTYKARSFLSRYNVCVRLLHPRVTDARRLVQEVTAASSYCCSLEANTIKWTEWLFLSFVLSIASYHTCALLVRHCFRAGDCFSVPLYRVLYYIVEVQPKRNVTALLI